MKEKPSSCTACPFLIFLPLLVAFPPITIPSVSLTFSLLPPPTQRKLLDCLNFFLFLVSQLQPRGGNPSKPTNTSKSPRVGSSELNTIQNSPEPPSWSVPSQR